LQDKPKPQNPKTPKPHLNEYLNFELFVKLINYI
jgi:hypothetical protein